MFLNTYLFYVFFGIQVFFTCFTGCCFFLHASREQVPENSLPVYKIAKYRFPEEIIPSLLRYNPSTALSTFYISRGGNFPT